MTYGEVKRAALQLIDRYSVAGGDISPTYNNQQDYINRMPFLVNDALVYIATHAKGIQSTAQLSELTAQRMGEVVRYQMPSDFFSFVSNFAQSWSARGAESWSFLSVMDDAFLLPSSAPLTALVNYNRYPRMLCEEPRDSEELDGSTDTQMLIPYYVASHLMVDENAYAQAVLYNEFETRLSRLANPKAYAVVSRDDVYGFGSTVYEV